MSIVLYDAANDSIEFRWPPGQDMYITGAVKTSILVIAIVVPAQGGHLTGGFGLYAGKGYFDLDNLNSDLARFGYAGACEDPLTFGFDSYLIFGSGILLGLDYGHYSASAVGSGGSNSVTGVKLVLYSGYSLYESEKWRLRPEIGIGFNNFDITLTSVQDGIEFDDVLEDPFRSASVGLNQAILRIGLDMDRELIRIASRGSLFIGFEGGYDFPIGSTDWDGVFVSFQNGPGISIGGFNAKFTIGVTGILAERDL